MAGRVRELAEFVADEYGGNAARIWDEAKDADDLRKRIGALPGYGPMKVTALGAVLAKRFDVKVAKPLVPKHPTLGDVDSPQALLDYQAAKRAHKAEMRAAARALERSGVSTLGASDSPTLRCVGQGERASRAIRVRRLPRRWARRRYEVDLGDASAPQITTSL